MPLTCLSNSGHVKETTVLLASLTVKKYFFYHVEGVCAQELTQTTPVVSGGDWTSREHSGSTVYAHHIFVVIGSLFLNVRLHSILNNREKKKSVKKRSRHRRSRSPKRRHQDSIASSQSEKSIEPWRTDVNLLVPF